MNLPPGKFPLILAPMAGVTDWPFRLLCQEKGATHSYTEMISAKALVMKSKETALMLEKHPSEGPLGAQLFGSSPSVMGEAAKMIESMGIFDSIDINMGCPAKKIVSNGEGSALLREPSLCARIAESVSRAISLPVTVKMRLGYDSPNALLVSHLLQESGIVSITIHPRTRAQMFSGKADWNAIRLLKESLRIPVVGNGDIFEPEDVIRMLKEASPDGVMIGRGALGNPWLFSRAQALLNGIELPPPTVNERIDACLRHCEIAASAFGLGAVVTLRKHLAWYTKGIRDSSRLRAELTHASTIEQVRSILEPFRALT
ncbi:MAG: tRNA dihydrouridine synthase DusB [Clostridiales bacterium]|nr:tRNA dihydrouridine synthase DusB [Clostridiales bacterium]